MSNLRTCPRCNERSYEVLKTHAYCVSCDYSPDLTDQPLSSDDLPIPAWAEKAVVTKSNRVISRTSDEAEGLAGGAA